MSSGPWKSKTTGDGLEFRSSLFKMLDEKHFEEMPGGGQRLLHPEHPDWFPYRLSSLTAEAELGNQTRAWDDLVSCSSFHRAETYMLTDGTVTVERPRDAAPVNRLPVLIWCATPTVAQLGVAIRADRHRRQGKKKA